MITDRMRVESLKENNTRLNERLRILEALNDSLLSGLQHLLSEYRILIDNGKFPGEIWGRQQMQIIEDAQNIIWKTKEGMSNHD